MALTDNAKGFWDLASDVLDKSSNANDGTNSGVTFSGGKGVFSGSAYIDLPPSMLGANTYTLAIWIIPITLAAYNPVFAMYNSDGDSLEFAITNEGGVGSGWLPNYSGTTRIAAGTFVPSTQYHVVASMSAGTVKVYINGVLVYTSTGNLSTFNGGCRIGTRGSSGLFFVGTVQNCGLFSDAKDATWVTSVYNSGTPLTWAGMSGGGGSISGTFYNANGPGTITLTGTAETVNVVGGRGTVTVTGLAGTFNADNGVGKFIVA